jgi:hypothetical protein
MESYDGKINFHYIKITLNNRASRDDIVRTTSYFFMGPSLCLHITLAYNPSIIFLSINLGDANYIVSISVKTFCSMLQYIFIQLVGRRTKFRKKLCMVRQHKVYAILDSIEPLSWWNITCQCQSRVRLNAAFWLSILFICCLYLKG